MYLIPDIIINQIHIMITFFIKYTVRYYLNTNN